MESRFDREMREERKSILEERLNFVRLWANYVRTHTNSEWSMQQAMLINSQMAGKPDIKAYLKMKRISGE